MIYCAKCHSEIKNIYDFKGCEACSSTVYIKGNIKIQDDNVICICSSDVFKNVSFGDGENGFSNIFKCTKCHREINLVSVKMKSEYEKYEEMDFEDIEEE